MLCSPLKVNWYFRWLCFLEMEITCPSKTSLDFRQLHSNISQQAEIFITTAARTSNPISSLTSYNYKNIIELNYIHIQTSTTVHVNWQSNHFKICNTTLQQCQQRSSHKSNIIVTWSEMTGNLSTYNVDKHVPYSKIMSQKNKKRLVKITITTCSLHTFSQWFYLI